MEQTRHERVDTSVDGIASPARLGTIHVQGADAAQFLDAQLTNTVPALAEARSRLAAWCDAKGRVQALFRIMRCSEDSFVLVATHELIPALVQRLQMFVLRARVAVEDSSADTALLGVFGEAANTLADTLPSEPGASAALIDGTIIRMPGPAARYLVVGKAAAAGTPESAPHLDENAWELADIRAGLPAIRSATQGQFVPQMLNLHWVSGIDFHKGCYPGQEVVARLQFRGKLKQRVYRAAVAFDAAPGDTVDDGDSNAGMVLRAATTPDGECEVLAVIQTGASPETLTVRGQPLRMLTLPYATPA